MARRIRFPWLVDLTLVADPAEIALFADDARLDRRFAGRSRGPLVNRLLTGRIRRWFHARGTPLPALAGRDDAERQRGSRELATALATTQPLWTDAQLDRLGAYVNGRGSRDEIGVVVQALVGRAVRDGYRADAASWEAARLIDAYRDGFALRQIGWLLTGRLRRARQLLDDRAGGSAPLMHATAIGLHGIVNALERMRALRREFGGSPPGEDVALARCLHPPRRVPRAVEALLASEVTPRPLPPGAVVLLELERAGEHAPGPATTFMRGSWSACPAEAFVTTLLQAVWRAATGAAERRAA